jgi:hypothetical protein
MIFVFKSTQTRGLQQECKRFGRGLLGADPRLIGGVVSSPSEGKKMMVWRSSRYSSQGGFALDAGRVHGGFGVLVYGLYTLESRKGL